MTGSLREKLENGYFESKDIETYDQRLDEFEGTLISLATKAGLRVDLAVSLYEIFEADLLKGSNSGAFGTEVQCPVNSDSVYARLYERFDELLGNFGCILEPFNIAN